MKKILAMLLAIVLVFSLAACGAKGGAKVDVASPLELLNKVWDSYAEEEKFPAAGGDMTEENSSMTGPGIYGLEDAEGFVATTHFPAESVDKIDAAATLMHMMNANTMTVAACHVKDAAEVDALAGEVKDSVLATRWMCGFPEKLVIVTLGDYIVSYFGNGEVVDGFTAKLKAAFPAAVVATEEAIVG